MGITNDNSTIISIDAVDLYPSIKFKLVRKAVNYFAKDFTKKIKPRSSKVLKWSNLE
jgi:hypothetical protein